MQPSWFTLIIMSLWSRRNWSSNKPGRKSLCRTITAKELRDIAPGMKRQTTSSRKPYEAIMSSTSGSQQDANGQAKDALNASFKSPGVGEGRSCSTLPDPSYLASTSAKVGAAALSSEEAKEKHYNHLADTLIFDPVETRGCGESMTSFKEFGRPLQLKTREPFSRIVNPLLQRISFAVQSET